MGSQPFTSEDKDEILKAGSVLHDKLEIWKKHGGTFLIFDEHNKPLLDDEGKPKRFKRNLSSFALLLYPNWKKPQSQLSKWMSKDRKKCARIPTEKLNMIIEIFNKDGIPTTKDEFRIHSDEQYAYNPKTVNRYIRDRYYELLPENQTEDHYDNMFEFLHFLKSIRYDKLFPLWTKPIIEITNEEMPEEDKKVFGDKKTITFSIHRDTYKGLRNAAPSDYPYFQIDKGEEGIKVLSDADMCFLYEMRTEVIQYIDHLMIQHTKDLEDMCGQIAQAIKWKDFDKSLKVVDKHLELSDKDLILFDKYYLWEYWWKLRNEAKEYNDLEEESQEGDEK